MKYENANGSNEPNTEVEMVSTRINCYRDKQFKGRIELEEKDIPALIKALYALSKHPLFPGDTVITNDGEKKQRDADYKLPNNVEKSHPNINDVNASIVRHLIDINDELLMSMKLRSHNDIDFTVDSGNETARQEAIAGRLAILRLIIHRATGKTIAELKIDRNLPPADANPNLCGSECDTTTNKTSESVDKNNMYWRN